MIKTDTGYIAVFTKYDSVPQCINVPEFRMIEPRSLSDLSDLGDYMAYYIPYNISTVEDGLDGVKFVHYI